MFEWPSYKAGRPKIWPYLKNLEKNGKKSGMLTEKMSVNLIVNKK